MSNGASLHSESRSMASPCASLRACHGTTPCAERRAPPRFLRDGSKPWLRPRPPRSARPPQPVLCSLRSKPPQHDLHPLSPFPCPAFSEHIPKRRSPPGPSQVHSSPPAGPRSMRRPRVTHTCSHVMRGLTSRAHLSRSALQSLHLG